MSQPQPAHPPRTLSDGTALSSAAQTMFRTYADMAHNAGTDVVHVGTEKANFLLAHVRQAAFGDLMSVLPPLHAIAAHGAIMGYVRRAAKLHDESPDLCNTCTGQEFAALDPNFAESGLNADLYQVLEAFLS